MNTSTEQIPHCNKSDPLADTSGRLVDLMHENEAYHDIWSVLGQQ